MLLPFREFKAEDLEVLIPNSIDPEMRETPDPNRKIWGEFLQKTSVAYTGCFEGIPIMAAGIRIVNPITKKGEAWTYFTREAQMVKFSVMRSYKLMFKYVLEACDFKTVRASVRIGLPGADTLVRHMGLKRVRTMINGTHDYYVLKVDK